MRAPLLLPLVLVACEPKPGPTPAAPAGPEAAAETPARPAEAPEEPAAAPTPAGQIEVVVRLLQHGPLGHGACTQRSYEIELIETLAGQAPASPSWVHWEHCGTEPPALDASNLELHAPWRLTLVRGASPNFGDDPMIVGAQREAAR
jgi:hypothetical protein